MVECLTSFLNDTSAPPPKATTSQELGVVLSMMACASVSPSTTASKAIFVGSRLLSRSSHPPPLLEGGVSTNSTALPCAHNSSMAISSNMFQQQYRSISSSLGGRSASSTAQTYSAFRNNDNNVVTTTPMPPRKEDDKSSGTRSYVSPYSKFFSNLEAGRTTLGTTLEMDQRAAELVEQRLKCGILESELRFQTTSYGRFVLPPHVSSGEHRVIVKVALSAIPFENEAEREIFLDIVGVRYNPKKGYLQLSSEKFASRIENKRYLVDMIERIVLNARKLAKEFATTDVEKKKSAT